MTDKQEPGFTLSEGFAGVNEILDHMKKKKKENQAKFDRTLAEHKEQQFRLNHWAIQPKSKEQWQIILNEAARAGIKLEDYKQTLNQLEAEEAQAQAERAKREKENRMQMAERNRFPNRFLRECGYLKIQVPYAKNLMEAATQASTAELLKAQNRLLARECPELNDESRNFALAWLNGIIQNRRDITNKEEESKTPLQKARSIFNLTRGH
jgi:hypothetical protein